VSEYVRDLIRDDEKRKRQEKLEVMLMEGIRSGEPTEMTRQDWADIRQEALKQFEARKSRKKGLMARVLKREAAKRNLIEHLLWYAETASIEVADRFLQAADYTLKLLSTQPESGSTFFVRPPELQGIRRFPVSGGFEKILVFYFPLQDGIDLVR
jgi:plasmid stabilization system protein ParE